MGAMSTTFEQWLDFVFSNPVRKLEWYWDEDFDSRWEALELTDALIVQYMTRLFLEPGVLRSYSLDQVEQGLWFLLGESSPGCSSKTLLRHEATLLDRVACIHAMSSFFRNFILAVTPGHFNPKAPTIGVTGAAYMWWDIFPMHFYMRSHVPGPTGAAALLSQLEKFKLGAELHNAVLKKIADELEIEIEPEIHIRGVRPPPINLSHDFLSPPDRIGDGADGRWNPLPAVVLCQLPGCKNCCHYPEHSLSTFIHAGHRGEPRATVRLLWVASLSLPSSLLLRPR